MERGVNATESQMAEEMQYCTVQLANTETILGGDKSQALEASDEHKSFEKVRLCKIYVDGYCWLVNS